jgi:thioesterase domain-containing protein/acyl carrier protein
VRAYVLDAARAQVPVGVTGELYLGGDGLARGYLNRPELTAERFVRAHVDGSGPQRLYRTGDLARWRADGTIEFLGRVDNQVKVRGYRIELGEIEAALDAQPGVRMSAVVVREVAPGDPRLIGYVAVKQDARAEPGALRRALLETLPRYMVPDAVVILDALPLNTSGKIDRKRLPAPPAERSADRLVAPRTPLEERLVTIWEEVLDVRPIGVTDDFFDLGATSITAARLFERIERELGATLPLSPLFQAPTVERLAALIEGGREEKRWTSLVPIQPRGTKTPIFCVHGGAGTILHFQPLARRLGDDQPFYGLQIQGLYGDAPTHRTIEQMATHYLREVRSVQPRGPYVLAGYCFGAIVAFEMTRMLEAAGERVSLLVTFNGPSPAYIRKFGGARHRHPDEASWHIPTPEGLIARAVLAAKRVRWALEREKLAGYWVTLKRRALKYRLNAHAWMYSILQRPLPDSVRERLIFRVCGMAEVRYRPRPIGAPMLLFHGAGLYRDPELGWSGLASRIDSLEVPGEHSNQRSAMHEPFVGFVSEQMQRALVTEQGIGARLTGEAAD